MRAKQSIGSNGGPLAMFARGPGGASAEITRDRAKVECDGETGKWQSRSANCERWRSRMRFGRRSALLGMKANGSDAFRPWELFTKAI